MKTLDRLFLASAFALAVSSLALAQQQPAAKAGAAPAKSAQSDPGDLSLKLADVSSSTSTTTSEKKSGAEDVMEDKQSFNTFTSFEDGQPGQPGEFQINYSNGWETTSGEPDPWLMNIEIQYTFKEPVLRNTKLGLAVPLELGNGAVDGNGDIEFQWHQRWVAEEEGGWCPTLSTVNVLRIPSGYQSEKVDWTLTGVAAKEVGPGTAYINAFIKSANGTNNLESATWQEEVLWGAEDEELRNFQWGFRFGYKWRITDSFALIADYVLETSELRGNHNKNIGEVSAEWRVTDQLTVGPGIFFGLDGADETPNFGAGLTLHYSIE